jgi:polyphosphate kinase
MSKKNDRPDQEDPLLNGATPGGEPDGNGAGSGRDFSYTQNREVSWLNFDNRILDEALDPTVPLFERLKFVEIFGSNLDEWFMIRVGGLSDLARLKHQPRDNKSNQTPSEQLETVFSILPGLLERQASAWEQVTSELSANGLSYVAPEDYLEGDVEAVEHYYAQYVAPINSPLIIDPRHPFPNLRNSYQYVACTLDGADERGVLGIVEVPPSLPRVVELPSTNKLYRYTLLEDVIAYKLSDCFGSYVPQNHAVIRVTRNADIDPDGEGVEEEEDYRLHMKKVLKRRQRLQPIRLEIRGGLDRKLEAFIARELGLTKERISRVRIPLDLGFIYGLEDKIPDEMHARLVYEPFVPQISPMVDMTRPLRPQIEDHDVLLFYPYESMDPLLELLRQAANDDDCISIKITLYRVAKQSRLCESLISAVENDKDVTVLMELRARFDEANNIAWAERLENAGCTVIYGQEGYKVHSKICQITYHSSGSIKRITCLGTGNFNEKTAKLYSDFMLLTAHEGIAEDGNSFFRNLGVGNLRGTYKYLGVAPVGLKPLVLRGLNREIRHAREGQPAQVFMKMNSLTDRDVIDKIAEACQAGVHVIMIVRGICCIKANVPGKTEGLVVREIAGRFLEHARVYAFGVNVDTVYLSSADMMTRNTERRVEIAYPVLDKTCRELVIQYMNFQLADNVKARQLTSEGTWKKLDAKPGEPRIICQEALTQLAYLRARRSDVSILTPSGTITPKLSRSVTDSLLSLPGLGTYDDDHDAPVSALPKAPFPDAREGTEEMPHADADNLPGAPAPEATAAVEAPTVADVGAKPEPQPEVEAEAPAQANPQAEVEGASTDDVAVEPEVEAEESAEEVLEARAIRRVGQEVPEGSSRTATAFRLIGMGFKMLFGRDKR